MEMLGAGSNREYPAFGRRTRFVNRKLAREWPSRQSCSPPEQRTIVEATIRRHCEIRGWELHALNARTNHIHLVVTGNRSADEMMNQLKAWCSRKLSDHAGLSKTVAHKAGRRHWFTEHGSTKPIFDDAYLQNAIQYVLEAQ